MKHDLAYMAEQIQHRKIIVHKNAGKRVILSSSRVSRDNKGCYEQVVNRVRPHKRRERLATKGCKNGKSFRCGNIHKFSITSLQVRKGHNGGRGSTQARWPVRAERKKDLEYYPENCRKVPHVRVKKVGNHSASSIIYQEIV